MRHFFIEPSKIVGPTAIITGSDARHINTVLRLKPGDKIGLFDGTGFEYEAMIEKSSAGSVEVLIARKFFSKAESPVNIIVAQALLKDRKMDNLVRQLTELGITKWIPFIANRSVPLPPKERLAARTQRWKKIAKEALKQCKRGCVPEIGDAVSFEEILNFEEKCDLKIAFWEKESKPVHAMIAQPGRSIKKIFVMLGPEGGFSMQEIERARTCGFVTAALGPRILRAETATIAACVLLQYLFGDFGQKKS